MTGRKRELVDRIKCRPALKPLAPTSGISGPPLPKGRVTVRIGPF